MDADPTEDADALIEYPDYVQTAEEKRRWDLCREAAEGVRKMVGGNAETVWLATRSLYKSDIPTDAPAGNPSEG